MVVEQLDMGGCLLPPYLFLPLYTLHSPFGILTTHNIVEKVATYRYCTEHRLRLDEMTLFN